MGVRSLGYVRLTSPDPEAWRRFGGEFMGMMEVEGPEAGSVAFRIDDHPARLVVLPGDAGTAAIGFEVDHRGALAELTAGLHARGIEVRDGTAEECQQRCVSGFAAFTDPDGNPIELYYGPYLAHTDVRTPEVSGFVTGDMGMGHAIVSVEDLDAAYDLYTGVLGFRERNTMARGQVVFLGCNPRQHTFGLGRRRGPGALMHLMVEVATLDDVGRALDRAHRLNVPMMQSLGRHTNDHMVSFYVYSPEGLAIEYGWDGLRVEEEVPTFEITEGAFWGHRTSPPPGKGQL